CGSSAYCPASLPSIREGAPPCRPEFRRLFFLCPRQSDRIPAVIQGGGFRKDRYSGGNVGSNGSAKLVSAILSDSCVPFFESFAQAEGDRVGGSRPCDEERVG